MPQWIWLYGSLGVAAFAAGAINSVAGGGTLLTFPTLLFALQPLGPDMANVVANATSTVALVPGSLAGAWGYRRELAGSRRWLLLLFAPSLLGGLVGAVLMVAFPGYFNLVIPWLLLIASLLFLVQPYLTGWFPPHPETGRASLGVQTAVVVFQFFVAVYGGYFGAGIGILMLTSLSFMGMGDVHRINAVKTLLAVVINGVSIVVFVVVGKVEWSYAAVMAVASIFGGYYGAVIGRRVPKALLRGFVVAVGLVLAAFYFLKQAGVLQSAEDRRIVAGNLLSQTHRQPPEDLRDMWKGMKKYLWLALVLVGGVVVLFLITPTNSANGTFTTTKSGLKYQDVKVGDGPEAKAGDSVVVHYTGWVTPDGATKGGKFDSSVDRGEPFPFQLGAGEVIKGWDEGVVGMRVGGKRVLVIPPDLAYRARSQPGIPANSTLLFEVELLKIQ